MGAYHVVKIEVGVAYWAHVHELVWRASAWAWCTLIWAHAHILALVKKHQHLDYWYRKVQENICPKYRRSVRLVGACHIALGEAFLGAFRSHRRNSYMGAYPGYYCIRKYLWATPNITDYLIKDGMAQTVLCSQTLPRVAHTLLIIP